MEGSLINRKVYKDVKKFDRQQMEGFLKDIYSKGFKDGAEAGNKADFKIKLIEVLGKTKGVGDKTIRNVMATLREMEKGESDSEL